MDLEMANTLTTLCYGGALIMMLVALLAEAASAKNKFTPTCEEKWMVYGSWSLAVGLGALAQFVDHFMYASYIVMWFWAIIAAVSGFQGLYQLTRNRS